MAIKLNERLHEIRTRVFGMTQAQFADLLGKSQGTICRWEFPVDNSARLVPDFEDLLNIRRAALDKRRHLPWQDEWFFEELPEQLRRPSNGRQAA